MQEIADDRSTTDRRSAPSAVHVTVATALITLATLQFAVIGAAVFRLMDPGWLTTDLFGTIWSIALAVVVVALVTSPGRRSVGFLVMSAIAFVAAMVGAAAWASLVGGPLILNETQAPRIATLIAVDLVLSAWLLMASFERSIQRAPVLSGIAVFATVRAVLEAVVLVPQILPRTLGACCGGAKAFDLPLMAGAGLVLGGFIVFPLWQLALSRWLLRGPSPVPSP